MELEWFDADRVQIRLEPVSSRPTAGRRVYVGNIVGEPFSHVSLARVGRVYAGTIRRGNRLYRLRPARGGGYELHEVNLHALPPCAAAHGGGLFEESPGARNFGNLSGLGEATGDDGIVSPLYAASGSGNTVLDIMVVYTDDARAAAGGTAAIEAQILTAIADGNVSLQNSAIAVTLRLVHMEEVNYAETANAITDITRLRNDSDGYLDNVHTLRNAYGADLVAMIVESMSGFCGKAFIMDALTPAFENDAFSVTRRDCIGGYTFIHEIGHNLGCDHDRDNPSTDRLYSYSWGHRFTSVSGTNRTVMALSPGTRILYFSNPAISYQGVPAGIDIGETNEAHNAATISASRFVASDFRAAKVHLELTKTADLSVPQIGEMVTYRVSITNSGLTDASGLVVTDNVPSELSVTNASANAGSFSNAIWSIPNLSAGASAELMLYAVVQSGSAGVVVTNFARIGTLDQIDDSTSNNLAYAAVRVRDTDIGVAKSVDNALVDEGEFIEYSVMVTNLGIDDATGVVISDSLPGGVIGISAVPSQGSYTNGLWTAGVITGNAGATLVVTGQVSIGTRGLTITNVATLSALNEVDTVASNNEASVVIFVLPVDLVVHKTVDTAVAVPGDTIEYVVTVTNLGPYDATGLQVTEAMPTGIIASNAVATQGVLSNDVWTVGTLYSGSNATLTITAQVTSNALGTVVSNVAAVTFVDQAVINPASALDTAVVIVGAADLGVAKHVDNLKPDEGETVVYTVSVTNFGTRAVSGVELEDFLPAGVSFVSAAGNGVYSNGIWSLGAIAPTASVTMAILATVNPGTAGQTISNTAAISLLDQVDTNTLNNSASASFTVTAIDLSLRKRVDNPVPNGGETIMYTITLTNAGPDFATEIEIVDVVSSGVVLSNGVPSLGSYSGGVWTIPALGGGSGAGLEITAIVETNAAGRIITNTASVASVRQGDLVESNNAAEVTIAVDAADLTLSKSVLPGSANDGDAVVFSVVVSNRGPNNATGVTLADTPSSGLTLSNAVTVSGTFSNGVWMLGGLGSSSSATLTLTYLVAGAVPGSLLTNLATITASDQADSNTVDNIAMAAVRMRLVDLAIEKTVFGANAEVGNVVNFFVTVRNHGPDEASGVEIQDVLPPGLSYAGHFTTEGTYSNGMWQVGQILMNGNETLTVSAFVEAETAGRDVTNSAALAAVDEFDNVATNNSDIAIVSVQSVVVSIVAIADPNGSITPSGVVWVVYGEATNFWVQSEPYYHIQYVRTNGVSITGVYGLASTTIVWSAVVSSGLVESAYSANLVTNATPEWWLAGYGLTNGLDQQALADQDGDGALAWQEYYAGTDPTNRISVFRVTGIGVEAGTGTVIRWISVSNRSYAIEKSTNLFVGFQALTNGIPAMPPLNTYTTWVTGHPCYIRIRVE